MITATDMKFCGWEKQTSNNKYQCVLGFSREAKDMLEPGAFVAIAGYNATQLNSTTQLDWMWTRLGLLYASITGVVVVVFVFGSLTFLAKL